MVISTTAPHSYGDSEEDTFLFAEWNYNENFFPVANGDGGIIPLIKNNKKIAYFNYLSDNISPHTILIIYLFLLVLNYI